MRADHCLLDTTFSMQGAPPFRGSAVRVEQGALSMSRGSPTKEGLQVVAVERLVALPDIKIEALRPSIWSA